MLRGWRCTPECGWRGLRFSRSLFSRGKHRVRNAGIAVLVVLGAALAVRHVLSRAPERASPTGDEGIQEVAD
jgi:hypothetical protein